MSVKHLLLPLASGEKLLDIHVNSINGEGVSNIKAIHCQLNVNSTVGAQVNTRVGAFLWDGADVLGQPSKVLFYNSVSGLGQKDFYVKAENGTIYYQYLGLINPNSAVELSKIADMPASATPIGFHVYNDNTGTITLWGCNFIF
jgi:hypothetical protein